MRSLLCRSGFLIATGLCAVIAMAQESAPGQSVPPQTGPVQVSGNQTNQPAQSAQPQQAQRGRRGRGNQEAAPPTLGLEQGFLEFETPDFQVKLVKASQTIAALQPKGAGGFDFTPNDQLEARARDRFHHLGDIKLRVRKGNSGDWSNYSTAEARKPVEALTVSAPALAAADLTPTLPADCPVQITRTWLVESDRLALRFDIKNKTSDPVQIGALGLPVVFNNMIHDLTRNRARSLEDAHEICSFADPYVGMDGGYLQVTRLNGAGSALVVVPLGKTPFEAYQLLNEPARPQQTFEGTFEWMAHTEAYASNEWRNAEPWNTPTSATLAPGETKSYGLRFLVADQIRTIEKALAENNRPVAVGIPGYILPTDLEAKLFLKYSSPVRRTTVEPEGAITLTPGETQNGWQAFTLAGKGWGRARLTVTYEDGLVQTIHYYVIKPAQEAVADMGNFLFTKQWYENPNDPFGRSPSVMSYDREADRIVTQDSRVWIAGLGDEGGSGSWLAAAMKLFGQPERSQVQKYEEFIDHVIWGGLQFDEGDRKYGVRKSLFYYTTNEIPGFTYDSSRNWGSWTSWSKSASEDIGRGYNYPHVVAAYWSMYRVARNHAGLIDNRPWDWHLNQAYETCMFMTSTNSRGRPRVGYVNWGLMDGTVFLEVLKDLKREGWSEKAAALEGRMRARTDRWVRQAYPFGSEMAWDSTGQEEVYAWCKYFGYQDKAMVSLNSIIAYMPTVPHWGYNGNARRYWDFLYGGKLSRIERQLHHYGSGLNAIPPLTEYREQPQDYHLLRIGYGGTMGALSNIDKEGFASVAFHSFPDTLKWDPYSGDYGPNFFGHALNTATYVVDHPEFGWQSFGGNVSTDGDWVRVTPRDSFRKRVYVAPRGLWLTLDAGTFETVEMNRKTGAVRAGLSPSSPHVPRARLRVEQPAKIESVGTYRPNQSFTHERDAFTIPLSTQTTWVELSAG